LFADPVVATAILDRLLHHSHVLTIRGDSYRLRAKRKSGLIKKGGPSPSGGVRRASRLALGVRALAILVSAHPDVLLVRRPRQLLREGHLGEQTKPAHRRSLRMRPVGAFFISRVHKKATAPALGGELGPLAAFVSLG
jgi:hypothetical protein